MEPRPEEIHVPSMGGQQRALSRYNGAMRYVVALALLAASCQQLAPFASMAPSSPEAGADAPAADGNAPLFDGASERLLPPDATPRDAAPRDAAANDVAAIDGNGPWDAKPPDSWWVVDGPAALGCAASAVAISRPEWPADMVLCHQQGAAVDQCSAAQLCNVADGWHLCRAVSEYAARNSGLGPPHFITAWIAGCIRRAGVLFAPEDGLCVDPCTVNFGVLASFNWYCDTGIAVSPYSAEEIALATHSYCMRVGVDNQRTEGPWMGYHVTRAFDSAVCCR